MLREAGGRWVARPVTVEFHHGNNYTILSTDSPTPPPPFPRTPQHGKDRLHLLAPRPHRQLTLRNLDITDTRAKLQTYAQTGLLTLSKGTEMPQLNSGSKE